MKKEIEFTSYYNLVTQIYSDVHEDKTISEVAEEITKEAKGIKKHDMSSVFANLVALVHPQVQQMEAMRADIYIQISFRILRALNEEDGSINSFESYVRHIAGLDTMAMRYDVDADTYELGFKFADVRNEFTPSRIHLIVECVKELMQRDEDLSAYPRKRLRDFLSQVIDAGTQIDGCKDVLNEAINILNNNSGFSEN